MTAMWKFYCIKSHLCGLQCMFVFTTTTAWVIIEQMRPLPAKWYPQAALQFALSCVVSVGVAKTAHPDVQFVMLWTVMLDEMSLPIRSKATAAQARRPVLLAEGQGSSDRGAACRAGEEAHVTGC